MRIEFDIDCEYDYFEEFFFGDMVSLALLNTDFDGVLKLIFSVVTDDRNAYTSLYKTFYFIYFHFLL